MTHYTSTLERMSTMARQTYLCAYTEDDNGEILRAIYASVKEARKDRK